MTEFREPETVYVDSDGNLLAAIYPDANDDLTLHHPENGKEIVIKGDGTLDAPAIETDDLQTKLADGQIHFASQYSGGDIESRLDSALSAAGSKEMVVLEPGSYNDRTISQAINIIAPIGGLDSGAVIANNKKWTINAKSHIRGLDIQGTVDITENNTRLREMTVRSGADITVNAPNVTIMGVHGAGSVTFTNGNYGGEIGIVSGDVSVTDNDGGNNIL